MIIITKTAFVSPPDNQKGSGEKITEDELKSLIRSVSQLIDESVRENFSKNMKNHVGNDSTYALKNTVLQGLKIIFDKLENPNTSESEKKIIALKLQERAEECTPGFHNGVNAVVDSFYAAKNINDLLYRVRHDIVTRVASQLSDDVHVNNRCFVRADILGYGVHALNPDDRYLNHLSDKVPDHKIEEALQTAFKKECRVLPMLQGLEDQLRGQLDSSGYEGPKDATYPSAEQTKIENSLKQLFKNHPAVYELQDAQDALNKQNNEKSIILSRAKNALNRLGLSDNEIHVVLKTSHVKMPQTFLSRVQTKIDNLSTEQKKSLEEIKLNYISKIASFNTNIRARLTAANESFTTKFFIGNEEGITDINWPNLRKMLWHDVKEQQYFEFTAGEDVRIDALMNPDALSKDWNMHDLFETTEELVQAINYFNPPNEAAKQSFLKHLNQLPQDSKYDTFKKIIQFLSDRTIKNDLIKTRGSMFISELKQDIPTLLAIIPFMTSENISTCLQDMKVQNQLLTHVILKHPQNLSFLLNSGDIKTKTLTDKLLLLIKSRQNCSEALKNLSEEQYIVMLDNIGEQLSDIVDSDVKLLNIIGYLPPERIDKICEVLRQDLPYIIESAEKFCNILNTLSVKQLAPMIHAMGDELLSKIIKSDQDFNHTLAGLKEEKRQFLIKNCEGILHQAYLKKDAKLFNTLINQGVIPTPETIKRIFYDGHIDVIEEGITFPKDIMSFAKNTEKITITQRLFNENIQHLCNTSNVTNVRNFASFFKPLSKEVRTIVFKHMKPTLTEVIQSIFDFDVVLRTLSEKQRMEAFDLVKPQLTSIVREGYDFYHFLVSLSAVQPTDVFEQQRAEAFALIRPQLTEIIQSADDFGNILSILSEKQRTETFALMEPQLTNIIKSNHDFLSFVHYLSPEKIADVCGKLKQDLPNIISSLDNFHDILNHLSIKQLTPIINIAGSDLFKLIQSDEDFNCILDGLTEEKKRFVIKNNESINTTSQSFSDFKASLQELKNKETPHPSEEIQDENEPHSNNIK